MHSDACNMNLSTYLVLLYTNFSYLISDFSLEEYNLKSLKHTSDNNDYVHVRFIDRS